MPTSDVEVNGDVDGVAVVGTDEVAREAVAAAPGSKAEP